jgi:hypothetical protein
MAQHRGGQMSRRGDSGPTQPGGSEFHRPKRAWQRTGRPDQLPRVRSNPPPSDRLRDQYGTVDRKRQGAQAGSVLILLIDGQQWSVRLTDKSEPTQAAEGDAVSITGGSVANSLRGRFPGEEVWLTTATGLPKSYGRRVLARVLEVEPDPRGRPLLPRRRGA